MSFHVNPNPNATIRSVPTPSPNPKIQALEAEILHLESQLAGQNPEKLIRDHIAILHRYNEIKDGVQSLICRYANITNTTIKAVHEELELPLVD